MNNTEWQEYLLWASQNQDKVNEYRKANGRHRQDLRRLRATELAMTIDELIDYLYRVNNLRWRWNKERNRRELVHLGTGLVVRVERLN